jgi:pantothenate kinase
MAEQFSAAGGPDQRERVAGQVGAGGAGVWGCCSALDDVEQVLAARLDHWMS